MADFSSGFGFLGGAVADLFGMKGHNSAASGFDRAAGLADQSALLSEYSGRLKTARVARQAYNIIGGQQADVAAAGFAASGSALDIMRSSTADAALAVGSTKLQSQIDKNDFTAQASAYREEASQARNAAKGDMFGGILKGVAAVASFFI